MEYAFIKVGEGLFFKKSSNSIMAVVGHFLADDVHYGGGKDWIKYILDDTYQDFSSNYTFLDKEDGNAILGCWFDEYPYDHALTVPIPVMIDLLEQWDMVCKMEPDEVMITYDQGKFYVEGKITYDCKEMEN